MEFKENGKQKGPQFGRLWWLKQIALVIVGGFYLYFGIHLLISAYQLKEPFSFILTFFASNFIILISAVLLFGFVYRLILAYRHLKKENPDERNPPGDK